MRAILKKTRRNFTGQTLARIAVEVEEEEDVKRLVEAGTVDWNERAGGEDPAIFWALNNERFEMVKILLKCPGKDLKMKDRNNCSLEKIARLVFSEIEIPNSLVTAYKYLSFSDRLLEGQEEFKEILKVIPGTLEYETQIQVEINKQNQREIIWLKNQVESLSVVRKVCGIKY